MRKHNGNPKAIADELGVGVSTYRAWRSELRISMVKSLTPKQRFVLDKRFGLDGGPAHTMYDVALMLDCTVGAIGSVQRAALRKMARDPSIVNDEELAIIRWALGSPKARMPTTRLP